VIYLDYQAISVHLIGNATHDAEIKAAKESGNRYGDFRLAVRDRSDETHYFPVRCFGKLAESVTHIKKGAKLFVAGELEMGAYADEEGKPRMTFKVVADTYRLLGQGRRSQDAETTP
jgi:single stranded DNA-binding protein